MENPNITLADIASMIAILDAMSTRGAIRANEMASVGELYTRLQTFMNHAQAQMQQAQSVAPEAEQGDTNA